MASSQTQKYANPDRLADVLALIQVLALHKHTHRSENGLQKDLQGTPKSANEWSAIARQHPEFFRFRDPVNEDEKKLPAAERHRVSLIARHVLPQQSTDEKQLSVDFVGKLLDSAIHLHDREISRSQRLKEILLPLAVALIGAIALVFAARVTPSQSSGGSGVPGHSSAYDPVEFEQVKLLAEYTIFHIGLYMTLASALIALVTSDLGSKLKLRAKPLWVAVASIAVAGLAGGVIASSLPHFRSITAFMSAWIGPYRSGLMPGEYWTYLEHTAFWIGVASIVYAFVRRDP